MRYKPFTSSLIVAFGVGLMALGAYALFTTLSGANTVITELAHSTGTPAHVSSTPITNVGPTTTLNAQTPVLRATAKRILTALPTATFTVVPPTLSIAPTNVVGLTPLPTSAQKHNVSWKNGRVSLEADDFYIIASGKKFVGPSNGMVGGDPGNATYCTLELEWRENNVPMRLYIYFGADTQDWWTDNIATRNGAEVDGWVFFQGKLFQSRLGTMVTGNYHLTNSTSETYSTPNAAPRFSTLHFENLRLQAFLDRR